jgi:UDP:flavonoid glycosyltransferase YjiC (YdhE family)
MKTLVFAVAGYNLAETGRMIEIARASRKHFKVIFASYGGQFEELIQAEGFHLEKLIPRLSEEKLARLRVVLSGETLNTVGYLSAKELEARVPNEIAFFNEVKPAAVLTGWCLSVLISTRAAGIPFVNVLHSTSVKEHYEAGLQSWPDRSNFAFVRWLFRNDEVIVYFAMGSSGKPELVAEILQGFRNKPYRVIAPVKSHIEQMILDIPENVIVTGFLPGHKVNPMAEISVIHGGQNTVMNACLSGTPIVGIGMHPEQQANIDTCVRKGFAIRLSKKRATASDVLAAIDRLLHDETAKEKVKTFREQLAAWNGPENAACFLKEHYG